MSIRTFCKSESGAVTVDWVVLTAAIVGLGVASVGAVRTGVESLGADIEASLTGASVGRLELNPYRFRMMTETNIFWNSIPLRRQQMASENNEWLIHTWQDRGVRLFDAAVASGNNSSCDGCVGAANRLDLMRIMYDEMQTRGIATAEHWTALQEAEQQYDARFGS